MMRLSKNIVHTHKIAMIFRREHGGMAPVNGMLCPRALKTLKGFHECNIKIVFFLDSLCTIAEAHKASLL